jgi:hypothetical protein
MTDAFSGVSPFLQANSGLFRQISLRNFFPRPFEIIFTRLPFDNIVVEPSLGSDLETDKETTFTARQQIFYENRRRVLGNGSVNTFPRQRIRMQHRGSVGKFVFYAVRTKGLYNGDTSGVEYLHRNPENHRRRRKRNPVSGGYNYGDLAFQDVT